MGSGPDSQPDIIVEDGQSAPAQPAQASHITALRSIFREERFFIILSVFIGVFSGLAVVCFRFTIDWFRIYLLGSGAQPSGLRLILVPTVSGLIIAAFVIHVFPLSRGSGVNQTKAALYIFNGYIPFRTAVGKFLMSALAIGSGFSLGPGGSIAADRRVHRLGDRGADEAFARPHAPDCAGGRGGRTGRGIQRAHLRGAVRH